LLNCGRRAEPSVTSFPAYALSQLHRRAWIAKSRTDLFGQKIMRAETQAIVEDIKQSVGLLRRHL
jgi:hypothetical protein